MIAKCPKPPKENEKFKSKYVLMKKVIVHATKAKITMTIRYPYIRHECLAMMTIQVKIMVTVRN